VEWLWGVCVGVYVPVRPCVRGCMSAFMGKEAFKVANMFVTFMLDSV